MSNISITLCSSLIFHFIGSYWDCEESSNFVLKSKDKS